MKLKDFLQLVRNEIKVCVKTRVTVRGIKIDVILFTFYSGYENVWSDLEKAEAMEQIVKKICEVDINTIYVEI